MKTLRLLLLGLTLAASARAQVVYLSNLGLSEDSSTPIHSESWVAYQFTTGSNAGGYQFDGVELTLGFGESYDSEFRVRSRSHDADTGSPGDSLFSLWTDGDPFFTPDDDEFLEASTTYWLVVSSVYPYAPATAASWLATADTTQTQLDGWTRGPGYLSTDFGNTWATPTSGHLFSIEATALTPVPEPSAWAVIAGVMALGVALWRRRAARV